VLPQLWTQLVEEGFAIFGREEAVEFQRELSRAGGLSSRAFREWARVRFDTDFLLRAGITESSRQVADQQAGYTDVREALGGVIRAEISIVLEVVDLRSGEQLASTSATGSAFGLGPEAIRKAGAQAAVESAKTLRGRLRLS
jgi:hypothetical protein